MAQGLIDADALKYDFGEIDDGIHKRAELYVTDDAVAKQPTIDAIPIDYMRSQIDCEKWEEIITRWKEVDTPTVDTSTIDAEPVRHGMFIGTEYDGYADGNPVYYEWKCSECGCIFEEEEPTYRYCPNCGARMDEE